MFVVKSVMAQPRPRTYFPQHKLMFPAPTDNNGQPTSISFPPFSFYTPGTLFLLPPRYTFTTDPQTYIIPLTMDIPSKPTEDAASKSTEGGDTRPIGVSSATLVGKPGDPGSGPTVTDPSSAPTDTTTNSSVVADAPVEPSEAGPGSPDLEYPAVEFIPPDIEGYLREHGETATYAISRFAHLEQRLQRVTSSLESRKQSLQSQIPVLEQSLATLEVLVQRVDSGPYEVLYHVAGPVHCKAELLPLEEVGIWNGAGVMTSHPVPEAIQILTSNLRDTRTAMAALDEQLRQLKDRTTTAQVNTRRLHNLRVQLRKGAPVSSSRTAPHK